MGDVAPDYVAGLPGFLIGTSDSAFDALISDYAIYWTVRSSGRAAFISQGQPFTKAKAEFAAWSEGPSPLGKAGCRPVPA